MRLGTGAAADIVYYLIIPGTAGLLSWGRVVASAHGAIGSDGLPASGGIHAEWPHRDRTPTDLKLPTWPLTVGFVLYPVWWLVGASWLAFPTAAVFMLIQLMTPRARRARVPLYFNWWLLFLAAYVITGVIVVDNHAGGLGYLYHLTGFAASGVAFTYIYNLRLGERTALRYLAVLWSICVAGGLAGTLVPSGEIPTLINVIRGTPAGSFTMAKLGSINSAYGTPRPSAPFLYANMWGAVIATVTPVVAYIGFTARRAIRCMTVGGVGLMLIPLIYSLDRGAWAALGFGVVYVVMRSIRRGRLGFVAGMAALGLIFGGYFAVSALGDFILRRFGATGSIGARSDIYAATWSAFKQSPIIGHGSAAGVTVYDGMHLGASIGSQGELWGLLYSGGLVATVPFYLFVGVALLRTRHATSGLAAAFRVGAISATALSTIYSMLPAAIMAMMVCLAGLARLAEQETALQDVSARPSPQPPANLTGRASTINPRSLPTPPRVSRSA